ncbi:MAG: TonB-dependent receptor plug domain-containing protein [Verrucomicrobia bacterium]|nr:TonB-dependent receptor plug domain-containing protein [Verrucomicrobiota bacterium]MDA1005659.1 TonB-dependent receptor plug domain-containing protein [Verrucomicrobiota bacterium]
MNKARLAVLTGVALGVCAGAAPGIVVGNSRSTGPVDVVTSSDLESTGAVTADALLRAMPQGRSFRDVASLTPGVADVNLRGLGSSRSLVLVDGVPALRGGIGYGYHGDPSYNGSDSSEFGNIQVQGGTLFGQGAVSGVLVVGLDIKRYSERLENADNDRSTYDFDMALALNREFSPSVDLHSVIRMHYGDHGSLGTGYLKPGVLFNEVLDWQSRTSLDYRFDGQSLGSGGLGFSTYYHTQAFFEASGDFNDTTKIAVGQELRYTTSSDATIFGNVEYGIRNWDKAVDYDSSWISGSVGVRLGGARWNVDGSVGWQWTDYDDLKESRDTGTASLSYQNYFTDRVGLTLNANYGVQQVFVNEGGNAFVDPTGLFLGSRLDVEVNDQASVALSFNFLDVSSEWNNKDLHRGSIGLDGYFKFSENFTINPGLTWVNNEDVPSGSDDFVIGRLGVTATF